MKFWHRWSFLSAAQANDEATYYRALLLAGRLILYNFLRALYEKIPSKKDH
jgi:hypothetical protein